MIPHSTRGTGKIIPICLVLSFFILACERQDKSQVQQSQENPSAAAPAAHSGKTPDGESIIRTATVPNDGSSCYRCHSSGSVGIMLAEHSGGEKSITLFSPYMQYPGDGRIRLKEFSYHPGDRLDDLGFGIKRGAPEAAATAVDQLTLGEMFVSAAANIGVPQDWLKVKLGIMTLAPTEMIRALRYCQELKSQIMTFAPEKGKGTLPLRPSNFVNTYAGHVLPGSDSALILYGTGESYIDLDKSIKVNNWGPGAVIANVRISDTINPSSDNGSTFRVDSDGTINVSKAIGRPSQKGQ